jgi:hypothetical protein
LKNTDRIFDLKLINTNYSCPMNGYEKHMEIPDWLCNDHSECHMPIWEDDTPTLCKKIWKRIFRTLLGKYIVNKYDK